MFEEIPTVNFLPTFAQEYFNYVMNNDSSVISNLILEKNYILLWDEWSVISIICKILGTLFYIISRK